MDVIKIIQDKDKNNLPVVKVANKNQKQAIESLTNSKTLSLKNINAFMNVIKIIQEDVSDDDLLQAYKSLKDFRF